MLRALLYLDNFGVDDSAMNSFRQVVEQSRHRKDLKVPRNKVFANNYVNFESIDVVGFDLDYTLVTYTESLHELIYNLAKDVLVSSYGFSERLSEKKFDPHFAIRGLSVDLQHGVLCKLSYLQKVGSKFVYKVMRLRLIGSR